MKPWMLFFLVLPLGALLLRTGSQAGDALTPQELNTLLQKKAVAQLVDVRTPGEYAQGHLAGSVLIPVSDLPQRFSELDPKKPVVFYCRTGHRSSNALAMAKQHGFKAAQHLSGGIMAWNAADLPVVR